MDAMIGLDFTQVYTALLAVYMQKRNMFKVVCRVPIHERVLM